jgi:RHS repeat-associated protein
MVDRNGNVVNNYSYDEWGNITASSETVSNPFKYAGEVYDSETGLYYLRARYYDPTVGRFLNEDTVEGQIDNPLTLNLYTYCQNNPILYKDPTGNMSVKALNATSVSYNGGWLSGREVSTYTLVKNGFGVYTALHEIAQLNIAKELSKLGYATILEYKVNNKYEVDVATIGGMIWEVKPITQIRKNSAQKQVEKYTGLDGSLSPGDVLERSITGIPVFKDIYMDIEFGDPGTAYYSLYRMKDGERVAVSNREFLVEYLTYKFVESMQKLADEVGDVITGSTENNYSFYWNTPLPSYQYLY